MDKRYYYRVLGLPEGAGIAQIKAGYEKTVRKLKSPDYADDPEYVAKKLDQARHAYSVLTGGTLPATKEQESARFERWKDAEDGGEDTIGELKRAFEKHVKDCRPAAGKKKTFYSPEEKRQRGMDGSKRLSKLLVIGFAILSIFGSMLGACVNMVVSEVEDYYEHSLQPVPDYSVESELAD